jgi:hypothetical protein
MKERDTLGGRRFGREINSNIKPRKLGWDDIATI